MKASLLASAKVGKTHGLDGSLRIFSLSGETKHLRKLSKCTIRTKEGRELCLSIDSVKTDGDLLLMKFTGYDTPEKARALSQSLLLIDRDDAPKLKRGEYYYADLYGMDVISGGTKVGVVENTMEGSQALLLKVRKVSDNRISLVPLMPVYVGEVDVEANTLELLAPYLLD